MIDIPRRKCAECGAEFEPRHVASKYCSPKCSREADRRKQKEYSARRTKERDEERKRKRRKCAILTCQRSFIPRSSSNKYCSDQCAAEGVIQAIERQRQRRLERKKMNEMLKTEARAQDTH